ncbi:MAG TPA: methyltransferase domain-containing protein [Roseiflexaceae bacterium]|nr:methyltransferase domain-containing protein [Roseiflexaceae bacterium]
MPASIHQSQIAGNRWDPGQYLAFADHRLRPALELLSRVPPANPQVIYDLGCGTGQVTRMIAERWPAARVYGRDNSPQILQQAAATPGSVTWIQADIADWQPPEAPDLIYSNATLHWVAGHNELFPRLLRLLPPGGLLAVQMPLSWDAPSHRLMRETLANGGPGGRPLGSDKLHQATATAWVASAADYYDLLADTARSLDIWETEYLQVLEGDDPVLEWVKGTGLRPILNGLADDERDLFLTAYRERLRRAYPRRADGRTLYPFRRLFMIAAM